MRHRIVRMLCCVILVFCALLTNCKPAQSSDGLHSVYFATLPPYAALPSERSCSAEITPTPETVVANLPFNHNKPSSREIAAFHLGSIFQAPLPGVDYARIDGDYSGSTDMILKWAACKWGIDEDLVRAQAWTESKWIQGGDEPSQGGGDKRYIKTECVRGTFYALWDYACDNCCYQSWGILQTKVYYAPNTWPMIKDSTAFNADYRYAEERACINGAFRSYFNSAAQQPNTYAEDVADRNLNRLLWGCTGMHFSGSWYDPAALRYMGEVRQALINKPWKRLPRR